MNTAELVARAIFTATANTVAGESPLIDSDAEAYTLVPRAMHKLAQQVADDGRTRHLLEREVFIAITDGIGNIEGAGILTERADLATIKDDQGVIYQRIPQLQTFYLPQSTWCGYYCLANNRLYMKAISSGAMGDVPTPISWNGPYIPNPDDVPGELEEDAVAILAALLLKEDF